MKTKKQIKKAIDKINDFKWNLSRDLPPHANISETTKIILATLEWVLEEDNEDDN